ncbi:YchJ family metal-binding protein [Sphingobacterium sp. DR205]|uniref:YchJ family protein n=1 Tax=Sphingobacterium sp. DR205 TaxID=2713573 RepID=UPI001F4989B6|nr:YchJ family metal-binding protein [Sphingobacterium sp. DR205]
MTETTHSCPCGSGLTFAECCQQVHSNYTKATTAEALMRARYSAFVVGNIDFLYNTFHPTTRRFQNKNAIEQWAKENKWMQLNILKATFSTVEFEAHYLDSELQVQIHHEKSTFKQQGDLWYYVDGR